MIHKPHRRANGANLLTSSETFNMNIRLTLTASALGAIAAVSGAPSYAQVDPNKTLDQFEATFGKFAGYRRSGAKGVCAGPRKPGPGSLEGGCSILAASPTEPKNVQLLQ